MSRARRIASFLLGVIGILPIVWLLVSSGTQTPAWRIGLHVVLLLIASASPITVGHVNVSLIFPVISPAIVTMEPAAAGLVGAIGSVQRTQLASGPDLLMANRALVGLPTLLASAMYHAMSGGAELWSVRSIAAMVLCSYCYTIANNLLAILLIKIRRSQQELRILSMMINHLRSFTFSLTIGLVMTFVYTVSEPFFVILVVLFYLNRETFYATVVNQNLYTQIISAMVKVIENVDPYTKGHSERVAAYCQAIGKGLGLKPLELNRLHLIAMLHDLGKQSVPAHILRKRTRLAPAEMPLIQKHPEKGADMLRGISLFSPNHLRAISEHHERWDGTGYPKGLAGGDIDPWARIIAVADAFDAMTTDRPYRPAIEPRAALRELQRSAGTQFDARMVSVFASVFDSQPVQMAIQTALTSRLEAAAASEPSDELDDTDDARSRSQLDWQ